jgi:hypothetical protein
MTASLATNPTIPAAKPLPRLWTTFSVRTGNAIQLAATATGAAMIAAAAAARSLPGSARVAMLAVGWLAAYLTSHAIAHVAVGRLVGIRFRAYGVRGTDHPENYPPGIRHIMSILPMWSAITEKASMRQAGPRAKAAMFAAGETSTTVVSMGLAAWASLAGLPGGHALLVGTILWSIASTITVAIVPKGDYAKAFQAIGWRKPLDPSDIKPARSPRERTWGPGRRGPRGHELRNAIAGWTAANVAMIALWAHAGGGFPWFLIVLVSSTLGIASWAIQGRRQAAQSR